MHKVTWSFAAKPAPPHSQPPANFHEIGLKFHSRKNNFYQSSFLAPTCIYNGNLRVKFQTSI
ncbi:unnamed protein product, partial [Haemonchus placei]